MKISKLTKHLVLALALPLGLGACSSDEVGSADEMGGEETVETSGEGGEEAAVGDDEMLEEVTGESSDDFDSMELEEGSGDTAVADASGGDEMDGDLDAMEGGDEPTAVADAGAATEQLSGETPSEEMPVAADTTAVEEPAASPSRQVSSGGGDGSMVYFFDGSQTGAAVTGMNWQAGYGDNAIKFPCAFNKRSPLKEGEDRFGCVITENSVNTIAHVHEGKSEAGAPVLTKVTIDTKGAASEARWEQNLKEAGYLYHKTSTWREGLTAKMFMSNDHTTHVYLVFNAPEDAATLIFFATAKGLGKEITPVAANSR